MNDRDALHIRYTHMQWLRCDDGDASQMNSVNTVKLNIAYVQLQSTRIRLLHNICWAAAAT